MIFIICDKKSFYKYWTQSQINTVSLNTKAFYSHSAQSLLSLLWRLTFVFQCKTPSLNTHMPRQKRSQISNWRYQVNSNHDRKFSRSTRTDRAISPVIPSVKMSTQTQVTGYELPHAFQVKRSIRMHCKMVFNFTVRPDYAFKSCQTRWPLISLRNLILIGQLRIRWKQTIAFFHILAAVNNLNTEYYVIQTKVANSVCYRISWVTLNV